MQALVLDAATPLIRTREATRNSSLTPRDAAQLVLKLLGNASANISMECWRKATAHLNSELTTLVEDEDLFKGTAPLLFGRV